MELEALKKLVGAMTLTEKIGQISQLTPQFLGRQDGAITGPLADFPEAAAFVESLGSILGTTSREEVVAIQREHLAHSRLKIPLIFMQDVIHGYRTIFPIPLGLGATFDPALVEQIAQYSAKEAALDGIQVTFSPMVDLTRDARWGRVLEGTGEDPTLNAALAAAMVRGYQGDPEQLAQAHERIAACVKHFVGYGAVAGGRDYDTVDLSKISLQQDYLPAFAAAIAAGAKLVMPAFTLFEGVPATANSYLLQEVLREELGFQGLVISDWGAVGELISHGVARDQSQAAALALTAGVEMDMMSGAYISGLADLVATKQIPEHIIDAAVLRVLRLKNDLGLFEDPYRQITPTAALTEPSSTGRTLAQKAVAASTVLLKNQQVLPLQAGTRVAVVGPYADNRQILGAWHCAGHYDETTTLLAGLQASSLEVVPMAEPILGDPADFTNVDVIIAALGEGELESGEAASKGDLTIAAPQQELLRKLARTGKPVVAVVFAGRPLVLEPIESSVAAILYAWFPGTEGGSALAKILTGELAPSGRLPMSVPRSSAQMPLYYNQLRTGRPASNKTPVKYSSRLMDVLNGPAYGFGFGLDYGAVTYSNLRVSGAGNLTAQTPLTVSVQVENTGDRTVTEVVQCYVGPQVAEVARPRYELKHWQKIELSPRGQAQVTFTVTAADLAYVHRDLQWRSDFGAFTIAIGPNAEQVTLLQGHYLEANLEKQEG
ncbi:glycoside hydrolase family 3 N-terminal domain-containing protein [Lapidilactobacillus salsurivasis]